MATAASSAPLPPPLPTLALTDLPDEVLSLTVALGLTEACDVASFAAVSKRCSAICKAAPLRLAVRVRSSTPSEEQAEARMKLEALAASWPGTAELDLRGSPLEDADLQHALQQLPRLQLLQLSWCKKMTPALPAALAQRPLRHLRTITLQRCFQLTAGALSDMLAAAASAESKLSCAALSHLALAGWPQRGAVLPFTRLRALALHNCSKLSVRALLCISAACPHLELMMLGGTTFETEGPAASDFDADGDSAGHGALAADEAAHLHQQAVKAVQQVAPAASSSTDGFVADLAAQLAVFIASLRQLRVLELTFGFSRLVATLQRLAATEPLLLVGRPEPMQVWDLATSSSVGQALSWRRNVRCGHHTAGRQSGLHPADAEVFLCAAVNCSSAARQTPLHAAVEEGCLPLVRQLLGLGALVDARDRSGATPLFAACEAGHVRIVECLLSSGASATLKNSAGEAPLYIAALKGHVPVVDLLLEHCKQASISWQAHRDGDSWTPLMAAVVAGRTTVAMKLLQAAGKEAADLIQAVNRYGQNSLHIAARKGSAKLLKALVDVGGSASLLRADADGRTAAEIARNMRNGGAMRVISSAMHCAEQQRQRGTQPTAERPRANDHRQQHPPQRWVGRRLQQRKGGAAGPGGAGH